MKSKTRLTLDDRINLQAAITKGTSLRDVCKLLKKNRTTIYRELNKYYVIKESRKAARIVQNNNFVEIMVLFIQETSKYVLTLFHLDVSHLENILMFVMVAI